MRRRRLIGTGVILGLGVAIAWLVGRPAFQVVGTILLGWWSYLARVVPRVSVSRDGLLTGLGSLVFFAVGLHFFLRWFHGELQMTGEPANPRVRRWKPRWTASIVAVVVLMFVAGIGAAGLAHQLGWLMSSRRPHFVPRMESNSSQLIGGSTGHLKWMSLAVHGYMANNDGFLPLAETDARGRPLHGWQKQILGFMPVTTVGEIHDDLPWNHPRNSAYFRGLVLPYLNPEIGALRDSNGYALSHYAGNIHVLGDQGRLPAGWKLEPSANTILAGEVSSGFKPWGDPTNLRDPLLGINRSPEGFGSPSADGANFLFLDGSVRFIEASIDPKLLQEMSLPRRQRVP